MTVKEFVSKFNELISKQIDIAANDIDIDPNVMGTAKAYSKLTGSEVYMLIDLFKSVFITFTTFSKERRESMTADVFIIAVKDALDILASNGNGPMEKMYFTKISDDIIKESVKDDENGITE